MTRAEMSKAFALAAKSLASVTCTKQAIGDSDPTERLAQSLHTRPGALAGYLDGTKPVPRDGRVVRWLVYNLVWVAGMLDDRVKADVLLCRARALGADVYREEYQLYERWRAQMDARGMQGKLLKPGLHVAPFLSESGAMVMLAVDQWHRLGIMQEIEGVSRGRSPSGGRSTPAGSDAEFFGAYKHPLHGEGVHLAAWKPWEHHGKGVVYLAVDDRHQLIATVEVPDLDDAAALIAARQAVFVALEMAKSARTGLVAADGYRDSEGYEDRDDDDFNRGDEWKRGTRYDPRERR